MTQNNVGQIFAVSSIKLSCDQYLWKKIIPMIDALIISIDPAP